MNCPHCNAGFLIGPYWEKSKEGKVEAIKCVTCGFIVYHPTQAIYYKRSNKVNWEYIDDKAVDKLLKKLIKPMIGKEEDQFKVDQYKFI